MLLNSSSLSDNEKLKKLFTLIKKEEELSEIAENEIISLFNSRGENAAKILKENKLHKMLLSGDLILWEVEGRSRNYIIIDDNFCECTDFQVRVLGREEKTLCYHLLAKIIGEKLELYDSKEITDKEYDKLLESRL
jgi:predicted nucleic acid-binding Zn finger protein